jgi:hypothetical protein
MTSTRLAAFAGAALLLAGVPAWGHHAFAAEFDVKKPVHFKGTITKVELTNPHAWVYVDVKEDGDKVVNWAIEAGASPNILLRRGFTKAALPVGTEVVVDGYQAKDGSLKASGSDLTFPDGRKVFIGSTQGAEGPGGADTKK